jgi:chromosome condensin MukBEF MukE localization factor
MTFEQWYVDRFGITVTQAERRERSNLRIMRDCWDEAMKARPPLQVVNEAINAAVKDATKQRQIALRIRE